MKGTLDKEATSSYNAIFDAFLIDWFLLKLHSQLRSFAQSITYICRSWVEFILYIAFHPFANNRIIKRRHCCY